MAALGTCPYCGRPYPAGATFCPSCGAAVGAGAMGTAAPAGPPVAGAYAPMYPPTYAGAPATPPTLGPSDQEPLEKVALGAILAIVAAGLSIAVLLLGGLRSVSASGSGASIYGGSRGWIEVGVELLAVALVITYTLLYRSAFVRLALRDRRFSTPAKLTLLLLFGIVLLFGSFAWLLYLLVQTLNCAGGLAPGAIPASCVPGSLLLALGLLLIFAIIVIVGFVGLLVGIWRLGTRYQDDRFKVGAVLLIFPFINVVGAVLVLVAARRSQERLRSAPAGFPPG
ncbi:MAG TPA: DUF973 family protein [Thermoplasmata archaeon]|nr:DUF973 family protein [Thermoplasmata archaeon]